MVTPKRVKSQVWCYGVALILGAAMYLPGLWFPHWMHDAGLYAAVSLHLARAQPVSDWGTLWNAGWPYFNKPPLTFWITAALVRAFGESTWVLRLPCVLAALGCVGLTVSIVRRLHGHRVALLAGVLLALCGDFFGLTSRFRLDFLHTMFMLLSMRMCVEAVMAARAGHRRAAAAWTIAAGAPVGLAMLVKPIFGLLVLVLAACWLCLVPPTAVGAARQSGRRTRRLVAWLPVSAAVALLIAAPWHILMMIRHGRVFTHQYFIKQSVQRATGEVFRAEPWWWYLQHLWDESDFVRGILGSTEVHGFAIPGLLPLTLGTVLALVWWGLRRRMAPRTSSMGGLLAQVWTFGLLMALSLFADKRAWYMIPVLPGMAWISALWMHRVLPRRMVRGLLTLAGPIGVVCLIAVLTFRPRFELDAATPPDLSVLEQYIRDHPQAEYWAVSLHRYENAPLYIRTGVWPKSIEQMGTGVTAAPPAPGPTGGPLLIYDLRARPKPAPGSKVLARSSDGRFVIVSSAP